MTLAATATLAEMESLAVGLAAGDPITRENVGDNSLLASAQRYDLTTPPVRAPELHAKVVNEVRRVMVRAAFVGVRHIPIVTYTQDSRRWSGIDERILDITGHAPPYADCSSYATWTGWDPLANWLRLDDIINGQHWRAGYTGTMVQHGWRVSVPRSGDFAFFGDLVIPFHVVIVVGPGRAISHGNSLGPILVPLAGATQYRRYF